MPEQFRTYCDQFEVTSMHRPNTSWRFTDAHGHEHRWHVTGDEHPATRYLPTETYDVPTLEWVKTGEEWIEDAEEPFEVGSYFCKVCGEEVDKGFTADDTRQFIPGMRHYTIDGESVSAEVFAAKVAEAQGK
jgi:hypothetical protein